MRRPSSSIRKVVLGLVSPLGSGTMRAVFGVEAVGAEGEGVLQAMGDEQGGGAVDVALLDDELDDGGGGDGVQAAGGRVVEDQLGLVDEGAGDGHAALHAAGKARRIEWKVSSRPTKLSASRTRRSISSSGTRSWINW